MSVVEVKFPGNLAQVQTAQDLRDIPTGLMLDGALYLCNDLQGVFAFDASSLAPDDGALTIRPSDRTPLQAGRWVKQVEGFGAGPTGPSNNTRLTLTALKSAAITDKTSLYDGSLWTWTLGNYTGQADDLNIVAANGTALSVGAWVRGAAWQSDPLLGGGASATARLDAAIDGANGRAVMIPPSMPGGPANEPTSYPTNVTVHDYRPDAYLAGRKVVWNGSDPNGRNLASFLDDQVDPVLSNAALFAGHRATGTLPGMTTGRNGEAIQAAFTTYGTITNSPPNYIGSGLEANAFIGSQGGKVPYLVAAHCTFGTYAGSTTNVGEMVGFHAYPATRGGTGTVDNAYGIIAEGPVSDFALGDNLAFWSKGRTRLSGDVQILGNLSINKQNGVLAVSLISGGLDKIAYVDIGRAGTEGRYGVAGASNDFFGGTIAGDFVVGGLGQAWFMAGQAGTFRADGAKLQMQKPFYPATAAGALQAVCALYAGPGVPSNADGVNGSFYLRSDTPGTANQRLYVKSGGVWTGIL